MYLYMFRRMRTTETDDVTQSDAFPGLEFTRIRKLGTRVGYWPTHAPTVTVRAERVEKGLGTGGVAKVGGDDGTPPKAGAKAKSKTSRKYGQLDGEPAGNSLTAPLEPQSDEPYPIAAATESIEVTVQN